MHGLFGFLDSLDKLGVTAHKENSVILADDVQWSEQMNLRPELLELLLPIKIDWRK